MEEIICPQCERPNLIEAKKCWYCQTSLENIDEASKEKSILEPSKIEPHAKRSPEEKNEPQHDVPEWLIRVRAMKEADYPPEDEKPDWEQKDLFPSKGKSEQGKSTQTPKKKVKRKQKSEKGKEKHIRPEPEKESMQPELDSDSETAEAGKAYQVENDLNAVSDDLPDGFTKI